jgi:hypothetical protein
VTENDYELGLFNGDTGVIVQSTPERVSAAFERHREVREFGPTRLSAVDTVYAVTIHKSQGSQFDTAAVLLPAPTSRILTRELLYTAATRARKRLIVAATEETIRAALERPGCGGDSGAPPRRCDRAGFAQRRDVAQCVGTRSDGVSPAREHGAPKPSRHGRGRWPR